MVVYIVLRNRDMRNATNVFLLNLSMADLLVVLICMPSALAEFYGKDVWYLGPVMCKYHRLVFFFFRLINRNTYLDDNHEPKLAANAI